MASYTGGIEITGYSHYLFITRIFFQRIMYLEKQIKGGGRLAQRFSFELNH